MNNNRKPTPTPIRILKKLFLSAFVVITFIGYALHKPATGANGNTGLSDPPGGTSTQQPATVESTNTGQANQSLLPTATPSAPSDATTSQQVTGPTATTVLPTDVPPTATAQAAQNGQYKDGTYTGPEVDATYGLVKVQAVVQNGKITSVQFLEYPNDRRTSIRINNVAVPYLQQEAIQAQNANVDLITGATLTSEAFQVSLQAALDQAK